MTVACRRALRNIVLAAVLAGCSDVTTVPRASTDLRRHDAGLVEALMAKGFARQSIVDAGDHFILEGDIRIDKAQLVRERVANQWRHQTTAWAATTVTLDLSGLASTWTAAAQDAIDEWNDVSDAFGLVLVEGSNENIAFVMSPTGLNSSCQGALAVASWPSNGQPGPTITVDPLAASCVPDGSDKLFVMVHEIGHALGLRHSDVPGSGAVHIPGTLANDPSSVMISGVPVTGFGGFSHYDRVAAVYLFPASITVSASNVGGYPLVSWNVPAGTQSTTVTFQTVDREVNDWYQWVETTSYGGVGTVYFQASSTPDGYRPWTGYTWCGSSSFPYPERYTYYIVTVTHEHGTLDGATSAPTQPSSGWDSCS